MAHQEVNKQEQHSTNNYHIVACRLCGEILLFPKNFYSIEQLYGYECQECKRKINLLDWSDK